MSNRHCPFCGSEDIHSVYNCDVKNLVFDNSWALQCMSCGASTGWCATIFDAEAAWNRRVEDGTDT